MDYITIVGMMAATLTTTSFLPQLLKVWKTKSTRDISLTMFTIFSIGILLWLIYGILKQDQPVIIANSLVFIQAALIVTFKIKYK